MSNKLPVPPNPWSNQNPSHWDARNVFTGELAAWHPSLTSADQDIRRGFSIARARSRDLVANDPFTLNGVESLKDNLIGRQFRLVLQPDLKFLGASEDEAMEWAQATEREWVRYAEGVTFDADATRKSFFTALMWQVAEGLHVDGEVLGIIRAKPGHGSPFLTCLQLIEPERLADLNSGDAGTYFVSSKGPDFTKRARFGVERDDMGEPIAYHIRNSHPSDQVYELDTRAAEVVRVPRLTDSGRPIVLHLFDDYRPSMTRGASRAMITTLKQSRMLNGYSDAELGKAIMSASFAAIIESEMDYTSAMSVLNANGQSEFGNNLVAAAGDYVQQVAPFYQRAGLRFNGARVAHLLPNEKLKIVQSNPNQGANFEMFEKGVLHRIAAGLGVPYETLARNFSDTSYSAARLSLADIWRRYLRLRTMISRKFAMPFVGAWMEEAICTGIVPMLGKKFKANEEGFAMARNALVQGDFVSWGKPLIDPVKEVTADMMQLAMGTSTLQQQVAENGGDWQENLEQRAREAKERERLGLNVGGVDPTLVIGGGAKLPQDSADDGSAGKKTGNPPERRAPKKSES